MKHFNIYYLNFSKVYDLNMLLNNFQTEEIVSETQTSAKSKNDMGIKTDIMALNHQKEHGEYSKFTEKIKVKTEKSTLVNNLIPLCENTKNINNVDEGTLSIIKNVKIRFYNDEENQRMFSLFKKRIFDDINVEGIDINNLISPVISDIPYFMKCELNNETIVFKIPMEDKSEFENKYTIDDLLIGNLTIIGVYKGKIDEKDFKRTTLYTALENEKNNNTVTNIIDSSYEPKNNSDTYNNTTEHFIDIFAIIQNINPKETDKENKPKVSLLKRIKKLFTGE